MSSVQWKNDCEWHVLSMCEVWFSHCRVHRCYLEETEGKSIMAEVKAISENVYGLFEGDECRCIAYGKEGKRMLEKMMKDEFKER